MEIVDQSFLDFLTTSVRCCVAPRYDDLFCLHVKSFAAAALDANNEGDDGCVNFKNMRSGHRSSLGVQTVRRCCSGMKGFVKMSFGVDEDANYTLGSGFGFISLSLPVR